MVPPPKPLNIKFSQIMVMTMTNVFYQYPKAHFDVALKFDTFDRLVSVRFHRCLTMDWDPDAEIHCKSIPGQPTIVNFRRGKRSIVE